MLPLSLNVDECKPSMIGIASLLALEAMNGTALL
jgi:hypothetical protein